MEGKDTKGPKVQCAVCGDVIQSKNRRHMMWCGCGAIAIDGGSEYTKCTGEFDDFIWIEPKEDDDALLGR